MGACAKIWPPLRVTKGTHIEGPKGVKGLSLINVGDGHWQVAFHNVALYRFEGDTKKGQAKGQAVGGLWYAVLKSGIPCRGCPGRARSLDLDDDATPPTSTSQQPPMSTSQPPATQPTSPARTSPPATSPPPTSPPAARPTTSPHHHAHDDGRGTAASGSSRSVIGERPATDLAPDQEPDQAAVMPTIGALRCCPPIDPRNGASPKVKMPPSPPWSQYPSPSKVADRPTIGALSAVPTSDP